MKIFNNEKKPSDAGGVFAAFLVFSAIDSVRGVLKKSKNFDFSNQLQL